MGYQSRKRHYVTRRERLQLHLRVYRVIFLFVVVFAVALLVLRRTDYWTWFLTYFY